MFQELSYDTFYCHLLSINMPYLRRRLFVSCLHILCSLTILLNADIVLWNLIKVPWYLEFSPIAWWEVAASCGLIYIYIYIHTHTHTTRHICCHVEKYPGGDNCRNT